MDLSLTTTAQLIDALSERLDTCLVLGISKSKDDMLVFHRRMTGMNTWSLMLPLLIEIKKMKKEFKESDEITETDVEF